MNRVTDFIDPATARTIPGLFRERVRRTPRSCAYRTFTLEGECCTTVTWEETERLAIRWQRALQREGLAPGERVALMLKNSLEWVLFDLAALGLGLVTVPLFVRDRPENFSHIVEATGARLLLIEGMEQWQGIEDLHGRPAGLERIVTLQRVCERDCDPRLADLAAWLPAKGGEDHYLALPEAGTELATIVYTSGTTGLPKGVMLSHANILENASAGLRRVAVYRDDLFLSFLPLSHTLERTVGYYIPMMAGACVAHVRSMESLAADLLAVRPTIIVSVPLLFQRINKRVLLELSEKSRLVARLFSFTIKVGWKRFLRLQGRGEWTPLLLLWPLLRLMAPRLVMAVFGGRLRLAISGGAPLPEALARLFLAFGLNLLQGYGLTETSPVVSVNTPEDNFPASVGPPLPGVEVMLGPEGELLVRGANVMLGYWGDKLASDAAICRDGWFRTGDQAALDHQGRITITGRLKEIIVLSSGEKVPPEDVELAITANPLFEQAMVVGERRPWLAALVVLNEPKWRELAARLGVPPEEKSLGDERVKIALIGEMAAQLVSFPGYARIKGVCATLAPWRVRDGLLTATMKLRRNQILKRFAHEVEALYAKKQPPPRQNK
ncbi:MAG TPA: long-chain fatty acid--CoA ligase [Desulfuromonadaceae bacterium]